MPRNIINQDEINGFLKTLTTGTLQIDKWIKSNLRNYILKEYPNTSRVYSVKSSDPSWMQDAFQRGDELLNVNFTNNFKVEIENIIDYFKTLSDNELNKLNRISYQDALKKTIKYREALQKKSSKDEDSSSVKIVREYPTGFRWVELLTDESMIREGHMMGHCVGDEDKEYRKMVREGKTRIFSLRDNNNEPHCTVEYEVQSKDIKQIKGKGNHPIKEEYVKYCKNFLKKPVKGLKFNEVNDLKNIGVLDYQGKWYSMYHLPKNFKYNGDLDLSETTVTSLPEGLTVDGFLYLFDSKITSLPKGLKIGKDLNLGNSKINYIPKDLTIGGSLGLSNTSITSLPEGLTIGGNLDLSYTKITSLPEKLKFNGSLNLEQSDITSLPEDLKVNGYLELSGSKIKHLPKKLYVDNSLYLTKTKITTIHKGIDVKGSLYLSNSEITTIEEGFTANSRCDLCNSKINVLPKGFTVERDLLLDNSKISSLPEDLKVGGTLSANRTKINSLPKSIKIGKSLLLDYTDITTIPDTLTSIAGHLRLNGSQIKSLPQNMSIAMDLEISNTNITVLPNNLFVAGDLKIIHTNISTWPSSLIVNGNIVINDEDYEYYYDMMPKHLCSRLRSVQYE